MTKTATPGPDFMCIGLQKAGTGWLYDQLQFHPDFWMPPVKELHYFDRTFPHPNIVRMGKMALTDPAAYSAQRVELDWRPVDARDLEFYGTALADVGRDKSMERYSALFASQGDLLTGDVTPGYSSLEDDDVARIAAAFPELRIVLLVRDPVARSISQVQMMHRKGGASRFTFTHLEQFKQKFLTYPVYSRSFPTQVANRWRKYFSPEKISVHFFDDIVREPDSLRADLLRFLGADPSKASGHLEAGFNRKSAKTKLEISPDIRAFVIEYFADELRECAKMFGRYGETWAAKYGVS